VGVTALELFGGRQAVMTWLDPGHDAEVCVFQNHLDQLKIHSNAIRDNNVVQKIRN
jgi:hypothetical protein